MIVPFPFLTTQSCLGLFALGIKVFHPLTLLSTSLIAFWGPVEFIA